MKTPGDDLEAARIQREYARRDATRLPDKLYSYSNPAFLFVMQEREWAVLKMLRDEGIDIGGSRVLEVGCGTGHILNRFMEFGAREGVGIDLMETRVRQGKDLYPTLRLEQGNAACLPYQAQEFDIVMQFTCMSSVLDPSMRQRIADEMWRVLKPGGTLLFYDVRPLSWAGRILIRILRFFQIKKPGRTAGHEAPSRDYPTPIQPLNLKEIKRIYHEVPFRHRTISLDFEIAALAAKSRFLACLLSLVPALRTHYLVVIRKSSAPHTGVSP